MAEPTKAELLDELEALKAENAEQAEALRHINAKGEGFLLQTPNPTYEGVVMDVQFTRGQAFVSKDRERFEGRDGKGLIPGLSKADKADPEIVKRFEDTAPAEKIVRMLEADFGYEVVEINLNNQDEMNQLIDSRAREYAKAVEANEAAENMARLSRPNYVGAAGD